MMKLNKCKYQYVKDGNRIYRYPYVEKIDNYDYIGEEFDPKEKKWISTANTMAVKMSGEGENISEITAANLLKLKLS